MHFGNNILLALMFLLQLNLTFNVYLLFLTGRVFSIFVRTVLFEHIVDIVAVHRRP